MARTSYIYSGKNWEKLSAGWKITQMRKTLELSRINYGEIVLLRGRASWSSCRREMSKPSPSHVVVLWNAMKRATQQNAHVQTTSHISFPDHGRGYMFKKSWSLWYGRGGRGVICVTSHHAGYEEDYWNLVSFSTPKCFTLKKFILPSKPHAFSTLTNNCLGSICKTPFAPNSLISGGAEGWGRGREVRVIW